MPSTRDEVIEIAAKVFAKRGFLGTMLEDLDGQMNAAQRRALGAFASKSKLALAVTTQAFTGYPFVRSEDRPAIAVEGLARLVVLCRSVAKSVATDIVVQAALRLVADSDLIDADLPKPLVTWIELTTGIFEDAIELGEVPSSVDPATAAWAVVTAFHGVKDACILFDTLDELPRRVDFTVRAMLVGIGCSDVDALFPD